MKARRIAGVALAVGIAVAQVAEAQETSGAGLAAQGGGGGRGAGVGQGSGSGQGGGGGRARGGGVGGMVGVRVPIETAPIKGAPYFAEVVTESVQVLPDGNRIVRKTTGRVYRDSQGRVRRETDREPGQVRTISITDPVAGASWSLTPHTKIAWKTGSSAAVTLIAKVEDWKLIDPMAVDLKRQLEVKIQEAEGALKVRQPAGRGTGVGGGYVSAEAKWEEKTEKLPARQIEGVLAEGTRTTRTIPAGAIGNEQPIAIVTEQWRSPELQVLVLTRTSDPRTGETTYRLLGITRAEQAPSWFEVPADYTVRETGIKREARK